MERRSTRVMTLSGAASEEIDRFPDSRTNAAGSVGILLGDVLGNGVQMPSRAP
jgi:hypothetical protein